MFTNFYLLLLTIHGCWRWVVLVAAVASVVVSLAGRSRRAPFQPHGRRAGLVYVAAIDTQLFLGLCLYSVSPVVRSAWMNLAGAMKVHDLRFFSVEHITAMLAAVALAHVGAFRCRRAATDQGKYLNLAGWHAASLLLILAGIPWWRPFLRVG